MSDRVLPKPPSPLPPGGAASGEDTGREASGEGTLGPVPVAVDEPLSEVDARAFLVDAPHVLLSYVDREGRYRFVNRAYEEWFGVPRAEVVGRHARELVGEGAWQQVEAHLKRGLAGEPVHFTARMPYRLGAPRHIAASYVPHRAPSGEVLGVAVVVQDITRVVEGAAERERLAAEVADTERLLRAVLEQLPTGVVVRRPDGQLLLTNPRAQELLGESVRPSAAGAAAPAARLLRPDGSPYPAQESTMARAMRGESAPEEEVLWERPDGRRLVLRAGATPVRDATGALVAAVATFHDVTEAHALHALRRENEERHRHIFQSVGVGILEEDFTEVAAAVAALTASGVTDVRAHCRAHPDFAARTAALARITAVNAAALRLLGAREEAELLASLDRVFLPETLDVFVEELAALAEGRTFLEAETGLRTLTGARVEVLLTLSLPPPGGRYDRVLVTLVDVGARKAAEGRLRRSEERLRRVIEASGTGVWEMDLATGRVSADDRLLALFGLPPGATFSLEAVLGGIHAEDRERVGRAVSDALAGRGGGAYHAEYRTVGPGDGRVRWVEGRGQVSFDAEGRPARFLGTGVDITARKEAELERERLLLAEAAARREAEAASRLKDEFLATVSHELRTPLTAMLGWAQLLRGGTLPDERRARAVETIERNARAQGQLIEDLLDVSRIMSGKLSLEVEPLDLRGVVEAAVEAVRPAADAKGVSLHPVLGSGSQVMGDATRLQQVVWNLLANAVKFTPRGGRVRVLLQRRDSQVALTVSDTGQGIPPDFLPHVFERFRQADGGSTRRHGGLGLGLSIVRHLVEMHGGLVSAHSEGAGLGATFTVLLPVAVARRAELQLEHVVPPTPAPVALQEVRCLPQLIGLRLLLVDDEPDSRDYLQSLLEGCGAKVSTAASAEEAFARLKAERPQVLLSDVGMPGEDGYGLIRRVRALPASEGGRTPAVALTAYARVEDRTRALLAGFTMHVPKPVEPTELLAVLASMADRDA